MKPAVNGRALATTVLGLVGLTMLLTACGGKSSGASAGGASTPSSAASQSGAAGQRQRPGASGEIVAVSGTTLQVQNSTSQTAVSYGATTKITDLVTVPASKLVVGVCVTARPAATTVPSGGATPSASPSASASTGPIAAVTVTISAPVNGSCAGGVGAGQFSGARPSGFPSGARSDRPSGAAGQFARAAFGATGKVLSVSSSGFVVQTVRFARGGSSAGASASPSSSTAEVTVSTTSATHYLQDAAASASVLTVGQCATALGTADDTGAIQATSIAVHAKDNGTCTTGGFGG